MPTPLKPWFAVATPHEDVREGRLSEAVFAANLWAVVQQNAPQVYLDPVAFFSKTYLTAGLTNVLKKVVRALSGSADAGDRILSLQTAFGGGKTHIFVFLHFLTMYSVLDKKCKNTNSSPSGIWRSTPTSSAESCPATCAGRLIPSTLR